MSTAQFSSAFIAYCPARILSSMPNCLDEISGRGGKRKDDPHEETISWIR